MQLHHKSHYQTTIKAPLEKVWDALTNPEIVRKYFFGSNLITDWKVGNPIYFKGIWDGKPYEDKGIVQTYNPLKSLSFNYLSNFSGLPDKPENYLLITYEVMPVSDGTWLAITQTNYDAEKARHSEENWAQVISGMKELIEIN